MPRQKNIIKLKDTIGDITFYKKQDENLEREKDGITPVDSKMTLRFKVLVRLFLSLVELGSY
jgi:hypothetical protein